MATESRPSGVKQEEASDFDESTIGDDVEVNIAVVGKAGSGKSSFAYTILGLDEDENKAEQTGDCAVKTTFKSDDKGCTTFSHPEHPKINFSIFTRTSGGTNNAFQRYCESIKTEKFDVFLIFTYDDFSRKSVTVAKQIVLGNKPLFFVRTKFDNCNLPGEFNKKELLTTLRVSLSEHSKVFDCSVYDIHLISNLNPYKWDFLKLVKAIADILPAPKRASFCKIPHVKELIALENFHSFLKELETEQKNVTKILPNFVEIKQLFVKSGILGVQRAMNEKLDRWKAVKINLAILGNSGAGKSTFINAIRAVDDDDEKHGAITGVVETTRKPTPFEHPTNPNIRFWDLPGIGTPNYPNLKIFCDKVAIETYDTFLIICSKRFTNNDLLLAEKVQSMGKSFFFVRTKIDNDIKSEKRKKAFSEEETVKQLKENCVKNLQNFNFSTEKIFLISSFAPAKWDFDRLKKAILDELPFMQKESLAFAMRSHSKDMVNEKIEILRSRIGVVSTASFFSKFNLGPITFSVDGKLIQDKVNFYSKQLEFPNPHSEEFDMLSNDLQRRVQRFHPELDADICEWLKSFDSENTFNISKKGMLITTKKRLMFLYRFLNLVLDEMEEAALAIICEAAVRQGENDDSDSD